MMRIRTLAVLAGGFLAALVFSAWVFAPSAQARVVSGAPVAGPNKDVLLQAPVTCTLNVTTTSSYQNTDFTSATDLQFSITGLALVNGDKGQTVAVAKNYFRVNNPLPNNIYSVQATPDGVGNYNLGIVVYDANRNPIASNQDPLDNNSASISIVPTTTNAIYFEVSQLVPFGSYSCGGTYRLSASQTTPTSTPTRTPSPTKTIGPTSTPYAGAPNADRFEPNNNFDQATTIGLNVKYDKLNFVQWDVNSDEWDNDFFKVRVKPGMLVTCRTFDLTPGTDTNLILYDVQLNGINGQDDFNRAAGDLSSSVTYYVTYEGWLYALAGEGFSRPLSEQAGTGYSFECTIANQSTATPAPTPTDRPDVPTRTPIPTDTPIPSPTLTPVPPFVIVKPLPTPTLPGLPATQVPVSLLTYYDANGNNKYDPGEGIVGISARIIDLTTGKLLAQGLTDTTGRVSFTVNAPGAVQLVVPYLNRSEIILPSGKSVTIRVSPSELPRTIP